ncbi:MAG: signal peptidase I [Porphyromonadaceae bacterium]|nr:signal peptidase I [Porphyromonadaceae bacterium]
MKRYIKYGETKGQRIRRYIVGMIASVLFLCFCSWAGWLWILLFPLVIDYYFTKFINWGIGRNSPNRLVRGTVSLVGDLLFVVIAVTFVQTFFFQNFAIPTSSLEKTMLIGDYLYVDKLSYGPRMPMTPLSLPLVHNELGGAKTYFEKPQFAYRRLKGYGKVERNDLVVFNFPAGDTVATKMVNPDYYTLCQMYGVDNVHNQKDVFGEIVYRPIDKRDHYVKRCIGMPGDELEIRDNQVYINGQELDNPRLMQLNYFLQTDGTALTDHVLDKLDINYRDVQPVPMPAFTDIDSAMAQTIEQEMGIKPFAANLGYGRVYHLSLTETMRQKLQAEPYVHAIVVERLPQGNAGLTYPHGLNKGWTRDNYGPILIPKAGLTVELTPDNIKTYARCIDAYEGHSLEVNESGEAVINGVVARTYTFAQDYYFMMGDNRHNSADSRAWGFVPEDHVVGKPAFIWLSLNDEQGWFGGRIRFSRLFTRITGK